MEKKVSTVNKTKPFPVDKTAFSKSSIEEEKAKESRRRGKRKVSLEELLLAAKELGVEIHIPSSKEDKAKQESSIQKLGLVEKEEVKESVLETELTGMLHTRHTVGGVSYGPGSFTLSSTQKTLFNSLLKQDQLFISSIRDTKEYNTYNRTFIIEEGKGRDRFNKFKKKEVAPESFTDAMNNTIAVGASKIDSAGYTPNTQIF